MGKNYRRYSKVSVTPRRPYGRERLDSELKILGEYGLRSKKELWRVYKKLSIIRKAAKKLITLDENDPKRIFEGSALLRRMKDYGFIEQEKTLEDLLDTTVQDLLDRRLQTILFKSNQAKTIHHSRVLIRQKHYTVNGQRVNVPSLIMKRSSQVTLYKYSTLSDESIFGRVKRRNMKKKQSSEKESEAE